MLIDYTKYKDFNKIQDIFQEIKTVYDIERDAKEFKIEDWSEEWQSGKHNPDIETWSYDIYNKHAERTPPERYKNLVGKIKELDGISYAAVIVMKPQCSMIEHTDWVHIEGMDPNNLDKTFTLLYYLKQPNTTLENCGMMWEDKKLYLPEKSIVCIDGGRIPHSIYNYTDETRVTFCLSLLESSFEL